MFLAVFALASGLMYVGDVLRGFARGILGFKSLHDIASHLMPSLPSPHTAYLLDAPIAPIAPVTPLVFLEELSTPSPCGELMVLDVSPSVLPSAIPTPNYQLSIDTIQPNLNLDIAHFFVLMLFVSALVEHYPKLVLLCAFIARKIFFFFRLATSSLKSISGLVPIISLVPLFSFVSLLGHVPDFFSTRTFSSRLLFSLASLPLSWTGPVRDFLSQHRFYVDEFFSLHLQLSPH